MRSNMEEGKISDQKHSMVSNRASIIEDWLVSRLAELANIDPKDIGVEKEFQYFGLSSIEAVLMLGDLEEWLGRSLDPVLIWDYPTIRALAEHLGAEQIA